MSVNVNALLVPLLPQHFCNAFFYSQRNIFPLSFFLVTKDILVITLVVVVMSPFSYKYYFKGKKFLILSINEKGFKRYSQRQRFSTAGTSPGVNFTNV